MRASGVLLPIFSLPGKYGIGCLSKGAYEFVKYLKKAGQTYWQILPVGPTSFGDSPYQSFSTFAGNPYFISLESLIRQGLLDVEECEEADLGEDETDIDYGKLYENRYPLLRKAFHRSHIATNIDFRRFKDRNRWWLQDYCLFMSIKDSEDGASYQEWEEPLRLREREALRSFAAKHKENMLFYAWLQYEFFLEWSRFKRFANSQGIRIIGDIPIYVAEDSADAWAKPELFQFDEDCRPIRVAGCPPDAFSETGQLWGNPLYDWDYHAATGYKWWIRRMKAALSMYDVVRIDHFRGFDSYYSIEAGAETAEDGYWEEGPGTDLFTVMSEELGTLHVIAEDLGLITDSVREMVKDTGYPNMKVLQFAFDARERKEGVEPNEYLPFAYDRNCVVYTGTHDNETLMGYLDGIGKAERKVILNYLGLRRGSDKDLAKGLIRAAMASTADTCIIPMQDYLYLGGEARINTPSTVGENWRWRLTRDMLTRKVRKQMKQLTKV
ncbi:MAG: 4-alpha-glucanotransferase, partial [Lachnospiraceae bacterium]|nr:4-alpha-glucanotransferase [Lachnospiraceae bacterium]